MARSFLERLMGAGFSALQTDVLEDLLDGKQSFDAAELGIVTSPSSALIDQVDSTPGFILLNQMVQVASINDGGGFGVGFEKGFIFTKYFNIDLPARAGISQVLIDLTGAGCMDSGTIISPPQIWDWTGAGAAFLNVRGYGGQMQAVNIDGFQIRNRFVTLGSAINPAGNGAPPWMIGGFINVSYSSLGNANANMTRWCWGQNKGLAFRDWVGDAQLITKGGQSTILAPVEFCDFGMILAHKTLNIGPITNDGYRMEGQHGPHNVRLLNLFGTQNLGRGLYIGADGRTGMVVSSIDAVADTLTFTIPHRIKSDDRILFPAASGTQWGNIVPDHNYWATRIDEYTIKLAEDVASNHAGIYFDITSTTAGTSTGSLNSGVERFQTTYAATFGQIASLANDRMVDVFYAKSITIGDIFSEENKHLIRATGVSTSESSVMITGSVRCVQSALGTDYTRDMLETVGDPFAHIYYPRAMYNYGGGRLFVGSGCRPNSGGFDMTSDFFKRTIDYSAPVPTTGDIAASGAIITNIPSTANIKPGHFVSGFFVFPVPPISVKSVDSATQVTCTGTVTSDGAAHAAANIIFGGSVSLMGNASNNGLWIATLPPTFTADTHSNTTLDNISSMTGLIIGTRITGAGIVTGTTLASVNVAGSSAVLSAAATATTAGVTMQNQAGQLALQSDGWGRLIRIPARGLDAAPNTIAFVTGGGIDGGMVQCLVGSDTGTFIEFDVRGDAIRGNVRYGLKTYNNNVVRFPSNTNFSIAVGPLQSNICYAVIMSVVMPAHSATWNPGSMAAFNLGTGAISSVTTTIACGGARPGDLTPTVSFSLPLPDGVLIDAWASAVDIVTVRLQNFSNAAVDLASGTVAVVQKR